MRAALFLASVLSLFFPTNAFSQWLPANATDTDPISHSGSVGIGRAASQYYRLAIGGNTTSANNGIWFNNGANSVFELSEAGNNTTGVQLWNYSNGYLRFGTNGFEVLRITPDWHLGIGTQTPNVSGFALSRVVTISSFAGAGRGVLEVGSENDAANHITGTISFFNNGALSGHKQGAAVSAISESGTSQARGYSLIFLTKGDLSTSVSEKMRITATGKVGIGKADPEKALDVVGDARFSGTVTGANIQAHYQDLAEWVPAAEDLDAGVVVVLDPNVPNQVLASTRSYDTSVAGVVSKQPGIVLGEAGASKEQIATTGRVKVRVDATAAPIRIGDLLVTSDKPGTAMRSKPVEVSGIAMHRPGTVIGKALEPLAGGQGEILVLLSLQ